jgi:hypothetical protein
VNVIQSRAELRHRVIREARQEDDHVGPGEVRLGQGHDVLADNRNVSGQMVAEPAKISGRHGIPAGGQAGAQHRSDVAGTAGDQDSHGSNRLLHQSNTARKALNTAGRGTAAAVTCGRIHQAWLSTNGWFSLKAVYILYGCCGTNTKLIVFTRGRRRWDCTGLQPHSGHPALELAAQPSELAALLYEMLLARQ